MSVFGRRLSVLLSIYIVVAFVLAGPLHSMVTHDDSGHVADCEAQYGHGHCPNPSGDTSDSHHQTSQWAYIHSVLANDGKKAVAILPQISMHDFLPKVIYSAIGFIVSNPQVRADKNEKQLSRGVVAYRRFG